MKHPPGVCTTMNNIEKNTYVRKQITNALLLLLKEKDIKDISVRELTDRALVGRVSFYRNYSSKEDILKQESERLLQEWGNLFASMQTETEYSHFLLSLFDYFRDHSDFYTTLYRAGLSQIIMDTIISTAKISPATANLDAYMRSFWSYGIYGWIIEWIKRGMQESGHDLYELFQQVQLTKDA